MEKIAITTITNFSSFLVNPRDNFSQYHKEQNSTLHVRASTVKTQSNQMVSSAKSSQYATWATGSQLSSSTVGLSHIIVKEDHFVLPFVTLCAFP